MDRKGSLTVATSYPPLFLHAYHTMPTRSSSNQFYPPPVAPAPMEPPMEHNTHAYGVMTEKVLVAESVKSEPNYMELSHANPYTAKPAKIKSSPAISIHTDISRDSGFASSTTIQDNLEFESHYRQLNEYTEVYIYVTFFHNKRHFEKNKE